MTYYASLASAAGLALQMVAAGPALAQEQPPAVANASGEEAQRIQDLIAAAEQEGTLSYWDTVIQPETNDALVAAFTEHYGLSDDFEVQYTLSSSSDLVTRLDQAISAGRVTMDVASIASLPWVIEHVRNGDVMEYQSPRYEAYQTAFANGLGRDGAFAFNGAYMFTPTWNADQLDFAGSSYQDVIGAVPEGRISVGNVGDSATYLATFVGQRQVLDQSFFEDLAAMDPSFLVRSEQIASRLVSGQDLMAFSGMPTRVYQFNQRGANLDFMIPEEGVVLLPQATFILAQAPHPNAAKLWIDFILSEEGQQILVENEALISGRSGFESPLPDYAPSIDSLNLVNVDWSEISTDDLEAARGDWVEIFNP